MRGGIHKTSYNDLMILFKELNYKSYLKSHNHPPDKAP